MKYSFMTKTSFLVLCVVALTPCYLLGQYGDEELKPSPVVQSPSDKALAEKKTPSAASSSTQVPGLSTEELERLKKILGKSKFWDEK